jgi:NOL1/NOP2/sun family putative RNA methylase
MDTGFFLSRYQEIGGSIAPAAPRNSIRVNTSKVSAAELCRRLSKKGVSFEKIPFCNEGFYYKSMFSLGSTPEYLMGYYYIQEPASMLPALVLSPSANDFVLDMCAAPGSKTTQISAMMENLGRIIAVEKDKNRCDALMNNIERMGCRNAAVLNCDALLLRSNEKFDKILLDAPCSGNYAADYRWFEKRNLSGIKSNAKHQISLIEKASSLLKKGGVLVYSTCSLEPEEDEAIINHAIKLGLKPEHIDIGIGEPGAAAFQGKAFNNGVALSRRLWPEKTLTQGFFIAKMRKA